MKTKIAQPGDAVENKGPPAHACSQDAAKRHLTLRLGREQLEAIVLTIWHKGNDLIRGYYSDRAAAASATLRSMAPGMRSLKEYRGVEAIARMLDAYKEAVAVSAEVAARAPSVKGKRGAARPRAHLVFITAAPGGDGLLIRELGERMQRKRASGEKFRQRGTRWLSQRDMMNAVNAKWPRLAREDDAASLFATLAIYVDVDDVPLTPMEWDNARKTWNDLLKNCARRGGKRDRK